MKIKTILFAMAGMATAMQGFAELSVDTSNTITVNTTPEPSAMLLIVLLLVFKSIRKK